MKIVKPNTIETFINDFNVYITKLNIHLYYMVINEEYEKASETRDSILKIIDTSSQTISLYSNKDNNQIKEILIKANEDIKHKVFELADDKIFLDFFNKHDNLDINKFD